MNLPLEQPDGNQLPAPTSEWKLGTSSTLSRPLRGVELMVKHSEQYNNGNFQLTFMATLDTPLSDSQLQSRHEAAWWRTRHQHPIIGLSFTLDQATFTPHTTPSAAQAWTSQTAHIATKTTVRDVFLSRSRSILQPIHNATMTLITDPIRGSRGCVLHISHTLISHAGFDVLQEYLAQLADPTAELGLQALFTPENLSTLKPRLPQSISNAYSLLHNPSPADLTHATQILQTSATRWTKPTVGIPIHPCWKTRESRIHNETISFEPAETATAFKALKRLKLTLTTAFFACMISATTQSYATGAEEGAHLCFSGNGRRWIPTNPSTNNGFGPVTMPIVPAGMWVKSSGVNLHTKTKSELVQLAKAIAAAQEEDLVSPHILALFDQNGAEFAKGMGAPSEVPAVSRLTLTSQGYFDDKLLQSSCSSPLPFSSETRDKIRMTDFNTGGRNTDANVCFALNSFRDELRFNMLFDERFFEPEEVVRLGVRVKRLFRFLTGGEGDRARL
ncbi:hypothetical protein BJY04DRAFT_212726 [Aspergillus karnatakaensis]|uniref:uncharacterized protein n=1 Tax=Aspergillus karnatakaensis TaxID=1810916 RepID=UPI003CCE3833